MTGTLYLSAWLRQARQSVHLTRYRALARASARAWWLGGLVAALTLFSTSSVAQGIVAFDYLEKNIRGAQSVEPLKSELFGDRVSLFNGATEFEVFDIDLKGNNALPVKLGRRLSVGVYGSASVPGNGMSPNPTPFGGFGKWDLSVPHLHGTFDGTYGWNVHGSTLRCTQSGPPRITEGFNLQDIWSGVQLHIPGEGEVEVVRLGQEHVKPADGHAYYWGTRSQYRGRCISGVSGLPGEGFEFVDTNGNTYRFDVAVTRDGGAVARSTNAGSYYTQRQVIYLLASKVTDRFGNSVNYNYVGGRLASITSSDGRAIHVTYHQDVITSARADSRTWTYTYGPTFEVTNPDGSKWKYSSEGDLLVDFQPIDADGCHYPLVSASPYTLTAVHPSGATGVFRFGYTVHTISGTPQNWFCIVDHVYSSGEGIETIVVWGIGTPDFFSNYALYSKSVSGPGVGEITWHYEYGQPATGKAAFSGAYCEWCDKDKPVFVREPDGTVVEHRFGALWGFNSGNLVAKYVRKTDGSIIRSEVYDHVSDQEITAMPFAATHGTYGSSSDESSLRNRPVKATTVSLGEGLAGHPVYSPPPPPPPPPPPCWQTGECELPPPCEINPVTGVCDAPTVVEAVPMESALPRRTTLAHLQLVNASTAPSAVRARATGSMSLEVSTMQAMSAWADQFVRRVDAFDALSRPVSVTRHNSLGYVRTETTEYHDDLSRWALGQIKRNVVAGVEVARNEFDALARPSRMFGHGQLLQTLTYNADGTVATATDGRNQTTVLSNWRFGIPQSIRHPDGTTQTATVNDSGWITSVTDENAHTTGYGYDAMGRIASVVHPAGDSTAWHPTTQVFQQVGHDEYGIGAGHWRQTIATGDARKVAYFDGLWRPLLTHEYDAADVAGTQRFQRFAYDHDGRTTFASYPSAVAAALTGTWSEYDALGRTTSVSQDSEHGLLTTRTQYLPGLRTRVTNPRGFATETLYQAWDAPAYDLPVRIDAPEGAATTIQRDLFGKPLELQRGTAH